MRCNPGKLAAALALGAAAVALVPLAGRAERSRREILAHAMPASVFILAADIADGRVVPVSSGSGTIVSADGSIVTNYHVLNDPEKSRLRDLFYIGRFKSADAEPELACVGRPIEGKLDPQMDLALIKCTLDLQGRPLTPSGWPVIAIGSSDDLIPGEKLTIIGYPGIGGTTIHVTSGELSGWSGEEGGAGRAYIKTDAEISSGNSGGTALDESGQYIGVPTAVKWNTVAGSAGPSPGKVGLIRPIEHAKPLLAIARAGWTPSEGDNATGAAPAVTPAKPAEPTGVIVRGRVTEASNGAGIRGAFVIVFKPDISARDIDVDRIDEQALTYGQTNQAGEFETVSRVPTGTYTVAVGGEGFRALVEDDVLVVRDDSPSPYEPWDEIVLERE